MRRKVFISYHHKNDQAYKDGLINFNNRENIFIDMSVDTGDISDDLSDESIRQKIRDEYLKDTSVLILLVGEETKYRKHIDWEIYSSMYDGKVNKKSGILVITLPTIDNYIIAQTSEEKQNIYPDISTWMPLGNREEMERRYANLPTRIIDNLLKNDVSISVVPWERIKTAENLRTLIEQAYNAKSSNNYDLSRPMRRKNSCERG